MVTLLDLCTRVLSLASFVCIVCMWSLGIQTIDIHMCLRMCTYLCMCEHVAGRR